MRLLISAFFFSLIMLSSASNLTFATNDSPQIRPEFALPDLEGKTRHISEWDGDIIILNFWATWCPPCRKEIPEFVRLQDEYRKHGVQFIGVALDNKMAVNQFAFEMDMNYPNLIAEIAGIGLARAYGNNVGALPYSVVIDQHGQIIARKTGPLSRKQLIKIISTLTD